MCSARDEGMWHEKEYGAHYMKETSEKSWEFPKNNEGH